MAYADRARRGSPLTVAAVVAVHLAIGYAFLTGLAIRVIRDIPGVTTIIDVPLDPPPPPRPAPQPRVDPHPSPRTHAVTRVTPLVPTPTFDEAPRIDPNPLGPVTPTVDPIPLPPPPTAASQARRALAKGRRSDWITTADYPAAALRRDAEGTVAIRVGIGADGRVSSCDVTASSGDATLDTATCTLYARRARFTPALDATGAATASTFDDRVAWRLPE